MSQSPSASSRLAEFAARIAAPPLHVLWLLLALASAAFVFAFVAGQRSNIELAFEARSTTPGSLQIFHANNSPFSELRAHVWPLQGAVTEQVSVTMPTRETRVLRLDPAPGMTEIRLCDMRLRLSDGRSLRIPAAQIRATGETTVNADSRCAVLTAAASAGDPQASVDLSPFAPALEREEHEGTPAALAWSAFGLVCFITFGMLLRYGNRVAEVDSGLVRLGNALPGIYLVSALVFGSVLALVTPPGGVADEPAHMAKVVLVENGHWLGAKGVATTNPAVSSLQGPFQDFLNPGRRFSSSAVFSHAATPLRCEPSTESLLIAAQNYSPTLYMPAAFVLNVACRTGASVGTFVYGGRLANLLVAVLLTFAGLRAAGILRWPLFAIALFPMTLFEQASMTADSLILGMSFCMIGLQAGLASGSVRPRLSIEAALMALGIGLAVSKPGYAWVCIGFLFSARAYRQTPRAFWTRAAVLILLPWIVHVAWVLSTVQEAVPRLGVEPSANLAAIFHRPGEVLGLLFRTFFGPNREFLWSSMVGRLGWLNVVMHPSSYALAGAVVVVSLWMHDRAGAAANTGMRVLAIVFALGAAMLPVLPMYVYWTPPSALLIEGLQGRYFIPTIAFMLIWLGFRGPLSLRASGALFMMGALLVIHIDAIYSLAFRFYG